MNFVKLIPALFLFSLMFLQTGQAEQEEVLKPYEGPSVRGTDPTSLTGKVMTGYQGWFNCEGDGANLGWTHWATGQGRDKLFGPGNITVDMWPDVTELDEDELCTTGFTQSDGAAARVFSSHNRKTVIRHFKWMADYGIDGAFIQRFTSRIDNETMRYHKDKVLSAAREGANRHGRTYAVMYDLSSTKDHKIIEVFDDFQMLVNKMGITKDPAYQHHNGKPLVAIWGVGFNDQIKVRPSFKESARLIRKFKQEGYSVMLGIPTGWRQQDRDALDDPNLHEVLLLADVLSPWTVGRFRDLAGVENHSRNYWGPDITWTRENGINYMPVVFPGFSRHNMKGDPLGSIPRLKGQFLWSQVVANVNAGAEMLYFAMFDEVDEGTAIFKVSNHPPASEQAPFLTLEGLPSDFYLRMAGEAGKLLRKEASIKESEDTLFNH